MKETVENLVSELGKGKVAFTYTKKNGETRNAVGTTNTDIVKEFVDLKETGTTRTNPDVVVYFDLNKNNWRSFRKENFVSID